MSAMHELKTWPGYFAAVENGSKTFEVRLDDRGFAVGDRLCLSEWCPATKRYTGRRIMREVTFILRDCAFTESGEEAAASSFGLRPGYCAMAIRPLEMKKGAQG